MSQIKEFITFNTIIRFIFKEITAIFDYTK